jgi:hypothetical protein
MASESEVSQIAHLSMELHREQDPSAKVDADEVMARIGAYLSTSGQTYLFQVNEKVIGYSLVSRLSDPLNIREFFIIPSERGQGLGNQAVVLLQEATDWNAVDVDPPVWRTMAGGM